MAEQTPSKAYIRFNGIARGMSPSLEAEVLILLGIHIQEHTASHPVQFLSLPFSDLATAARFLSESCSRD